jgi:hypothetical protein
MHPARSLAAGSPMQSSEMIGPWWDLLSGYCASNGIDVTYNFSPRTTTI